MNDGKGFLEIAIVSRWVYTHRFDCECPGYWACPNGENGYINGIA